MTLRYGENRELNQTKKQENYHQNRVNAPETCVFFLFFCLFVFFSKFIGLNPIFIIRGEEHVCHPFSVLLKESLIDQYHV